MLQGDVEACSVQEYIAFFNGVSKPTRLASWHIGPSATIKSLVFICWSILSNMLPFWACICTCADQFWVPGIQAHRNDCSWRIHKGYWVTGSHPSNPPNSGAHKCSSICHWHHHLAGNVLEYPQIQWMKHDSNLSCLLSRLLCDPGCWYQSFEAV